MCIYFHHQGMWLKTGEEKCGSHIPCTPEFLSFGTDLAIAWMQEPFMFCGFVGGGAMLHPCIILHSMIVKYVGLLTHWGTPAIFTENAKLLIYMAWLH